MRRADGQPTGDPAAIFPTDDRVRLIDEVGKANRAAYDRARQEGAKRFDIVSIEAVREGGRLVGWRLVSHSRSVRDQDQQQATNRLVLRARQGDRRAQAKIRDHNRREIARDHRARSRRSGRAPRRPGNTRTRGSRRSVASSSQASRDGPSASDPDDEPPGVGARVRLDPGSATGTVERVRGEIAEVLWETGARCPVPGGWLSVLSEHDVPRSGAAIRNGGTRTPGPAVTRSCARCGELLGGRATSIYCSAACKQAAYRERQGAGR